MEQINDHQPELAMSRKGSSTPLSPPRPSRPSCAAAPPHQRDLLGSDQGQRALQGAGQSGWGLQTCAKRV